METLIVNLTGTTRREMLHGREHIVAPISMIVPGILNGSQGPLLYPEEEVANSTDAWNGMPIVVYHPAVNGKSVSARTKSILDKSIGIVLSANFDKKLKAEGWFDIEHTRNSDKRILDALEMGKPIELSTGLHLDQIPNDGASTHNGVAYSATARNYRPDHLAVLPDQTGACSLDDGCGVLVNKENSDGIVSLIVNQLKKYKLLPGQKQKETTMPLSSEDRSQLIGNLITNCDCWTENDKETLNEFEDEKLETMNQFLATSKANEVIVNTINEGLDIEHDGIAGKTIWNSEKGSLEFVPKKVEEPKVVIENKEVKPVKLTDEEWMASAPEGVRNQLAFSQQILDREKTIRIDRLVANVEGDTEKAQAREYYGAKSLEDLTALTRFMPASKATQTVNTPSYLGAATPVTSQEPTINREEFLPITDLEFEAEE